MIVALALAGTHAYVKSWASMAPVMASAFDSVCPVLPVSCYPEASLAAGDLYLIPAADIVKYASLNEETKEFTSNSWRALFRRVRHISTTLAPAARRQLYLLNPLSFCETQHHWLLLSFLYVKINENRLQNNELTLRETM